MRTPNATWETWVDIWDDRERKHVRAYISVDLGKVALELAADAFRRKSRTATRLDKAIVVKVTTE